MADAAELEELRAELERAYDHIDELEAGTGAAESRQRLQVAEDRARALEESNARLSRANDAIKDREEGLQGRVAALEAALNQNKEQRDEAVRSQVLLKGQLDKLQGQLAQCVRRCSCC